MANEPTINGQPGLVLGPGPDGWWDSERVSSPQVMRAPDGTWRIYYYGRDATFDRQVNLPTGRVGLAESPDGAQWTRVKGPLTMGAVLEPVPATQDRFDNAHVGISDIHYWDGLYWMFYFGGDQTIIERKFGDRVFQAKGVIMRPGIAISRDGLNFVRLEGPHRGAMLEPGGPDDWDSLFCAWPRVLREPDGSFKIYYHTLNPAKGGFLVGMATSPDGLRWEKVGQVLGPGGPDDFDAGGLSCRDVKKIGDQYVMFYEGTNSQGYYCIGVATSPDGFTWTKEGSVFCHAPKGSGRWDARAVGTPNVVPMEDGSFRMYYIGANEGGHDELSTQHQIGLAVSDGTNFRRWRRWGGDFE